jgi:Domain of unknown function (DUF5658)
MKFLVSIILLSVAMRAQSFTASSPALPNAPSQQSFWIVETKLDIAILAGLVSADGITTQRGLNQGLHELNPVMRPFVTLGAPGEAVGSALGFGAEVGVLYLLHRSHHYKAERVAMRLIVATEAGVVANNIIAIRRETNKR